MANEPNRTDPFPSPTDRLQGALSDIEENARSRAAEKAAELAARAALASVERAASSLLDGLESAIFGKVGGAAEAVAAEEEADPLERLRARYGTKTTGAGAQTKEAPKSPAPQEDAVTRAKRKLEEMKQARDAAKSPIDGAAAPPKRSL